MSSYELRQPPDTGVAGRERKRNLNGAETPLTLKATLASHLSRGRTVRFSDTLEDRFFEELAAERRLVRYKRGAPVRVWERIAGRRAESLDCMVYALAVRPLVGVDLDRREAEVSTKAAPARTAPVVKSAWLNR